MNESDARRYVKQAEKLWNKQTEMYKNYCGMYWLDGDPSWCLGPQGISLAWSKNNSRIRFLEDNEIRVFIQKLLNKVEEDADSIITELTEDAFRKHIDSEYFEKGKFPGMTKEEIAAKFITEKKNLSERYQKLIKAIKETLEEESSSVMNQSITP